MNAADMGEQNINTAGCVPSVIMYSTDESTHENCEQDQRGMELTGSTRM